MDIVTHGNPVFIPSPNMYGSFTLLLAVYGTLEAAHSQLALVNSINSHGIKRGFLEGVGSELKLKDVCKFSGLRSRGWKGIAHTRNSLSKGMATEPSLVLCCEK